MNGQGGRLAFPSLLLEAVRSARHVTALTGAGISAESGIPTFRQAQTGLWAKYDPQELATPEAFRRNPGLVWDWYEWRRSLIANANPNAGHLALSQWAAQAPSFSLVTQNVDGLHQHAGSQQVIELHGNIRRNRCSDEDIVTDNWIDSDAGPPQCLACGAFLRPDVVWFGESLPAGELTKAWTSAESCDLFLSVGTSSLVQPAASLPLLALQNGALVVEVNPEPTPLTPHATFSFRHPAGVALPQLVRAAFGD